MDEQKYKSNHNVMYACTYHVVFCPKYKRKVLVNGIDIRLKDMIPELAAAKGAEILELEVMPDHIHMLVSVPPQIGIHKVVKYIKGRSSHDLREEFPKLKTQIPCLWTNSYFVATTGGASIDVVKQYIENQKHV